jgi:transposase
MPNQRPLGVAELRKIEAAIRDGWSKRKLCQHFHRSYELITKLIKETKPSNDAGEVPSKNRDKIAAANAALAEMTPNNDIKKTLTALSRDLQRQAPDLKSFTLNLETGEVALVLTTSLNFKIGA